MMKQDKDVKLEPNFEDPKFFIKSAMRPTVKFLETYFQLAQESLYDKVGRALRRVRATNTANAKVAEYLDYFNKRAKTLYRTLEGLEALDKNFDRNGLSTQFVKQLGVDTAKLGSAWVVGDAFSPFLASRLAPMFALSPPVAGLAAFLITPVGISLAKELLSGDLRTGPQDFRPYYRPYVPKNWPIQHVPINSPPQPYLPTNNLPSIEAAHPTTPPDVQPEPTNPPPSSPAQPININIPQFFDQMLQSIYPPTNPSTTNDNHVTSDEQTTRNSSAPPRPGAPQDPYAKPPKPDPLFVVQVKNDSDNIQLPPIPTPPSEVVVRRPNETSHDDNPVAQVKAPDTVTRENAVRIEIGLDNVTVKTPNSEIGVSANPLEALNFMVQGIKYLTRRQPEAPSLPNHPELNKLDQLYSDFSNAKPKHKETAAEKVLDEIRGLNQKYPEQQLHLNAIEWAVNEQRNNPSQAETIPTDAAAIEKVYRQKVTEYVQAIGDSLAASDHQKAVEIERASQSLPSDIKKHFEPFVPLLNPRCSAEDLIKTRDHAIRSGNWDLFMQLVQKLEEMNPNFSTAVDQAVKGTILEDQNNRRRLNAQQQNRPTPPESGVQANDATESPEQINARLERRRNNFYLWCTTQTADYLASFIPDKEAKTHVENGIQISNSVMSSILNPDSLLVQAGSMISLSSQINNYTAQDENIKNALWFAGVVTHAASLANEGLQMACPTDPNQAVSLSDVASLTTGVIGFAGPYVLKSVIGNERKFGEAEVSTTYISYWSDEAGRFIYRNAESICALPKNILFVANHSDLIPASAYIKPIVMSQGAVVVGGVAAIGATGYAGYCFATRDSDPNFANHRVLGHLNNAVYNHRNGNTQEGEKCILDAYKYAQTPEQREEVIRTANSYGIMTDELRGKLESGSENTTTALVAPLYAYKQTVVKECEKQSGLAPVIELTKAVGLGNLLK